MEKISASFGVDHKVAKQGIKVICADLTREDHLQLLTGKYPLMILDASRSTLRYGLKSCV